MLQELRRTLWFVAISGIVVWSFAGAPLRADSVVVFNEIQYNPWYPEPFAEGELEWIEVHNQMAIDVDVSGWSLTDGVQFTFPPGTLIRGNGYLVVAASPDALLARAPDPGALADQVVGPFAGRLDNDGERLELRNNSQRLMDSVRFRQDGRWPVAADGSGTTLAKRDPQVGSGVAENWAASLEIGGTPGALNFPIELPGARFPEDLVGFWRFEEPSGNAADPAGDNVGRLGRETERVAGLLGDGALSFNNTGNAFVNVGAGAARNFSVSAGVTVEALLVVGWSGELDDADQIFRKEDGSRRILFGFQHDEIVDNRDVQIDPPIQPVLSFGINVGDVYSELDMPLDGVDGRPTLASLKDGEARHVAATYSRTTGRKSIFIDGVEVFSAVLEAGAPISSGGGSSAYIGNMTGRREPFTGTIDEVAIWNRALSAEEVAKHVANVGAGNDYLFAEPTEEVSAPVVAFNETLLPGDGNAWIELAVGGSVPLPLEGVVIVRPSSTRDGGAVRDEAMVMLTGSNLAPGEFLQLDEPMLGFDLALGDRLFLYTPERNQLLAATRLRDPHQGRHPDLTGDWFIPSVPTPAAPNQVALRDEIVINEILYHYRILDSTDGVPAAEMWRESDEAWIELYNRADAGVDLSGWRLDGDVDFLFPDGTRIEPGEYLVIAGDAAELRLRYPDIRILGDYSDRLSRRNGRVRLRDAVDNPADVVEYYDRGRWPRLADGGGSSLELRDPDADNSRAEAWAPSDESMKATWESFTYRIVARPNVGPVQWNEFIVGLLDAGEVLVDDLSVIEDPEGNARQFLQNGTFDDNDAAWRFIGNHRHSRIVPDPDDPENPVLHLVATGPTEHMHNHLETTLAGGGRVRNGQLYEISFRARWLAGSNQLNTRLYFNRAPVTTRLSRPTQHGTPGQPNSTLEDNLGPTFHGFAHAPVVPSAGEEVLVHVEIDDPDGVSMAQLWWSVDSGEWQNSPMVDVDGVYRGAVAPGAAGDIVQFYVEATDALGAVASFPADGRESRALFIVDEGAADLRRLHNLRVLLTPDDNRFFHDPINVMSNERLPCTVIYDERMVFYDVGVRAKGSQRGRPVSARLGYSIAFHRDRPFRGVHTSIGIDRSGGWAFGSQFGQDEIVVKHIAQHAGGIPTMYDDLVHVVAPRAAQTGTALLQMARYGKIYLDSQFESGGDGSKHNFELIYYPSTTNTGRPDGRKRPQPDQVLGTDIRDLGDDKEAYRYNFTLENNQERDDFNGLIRLAKAFSAPPARLEEETRAALDVDQWTRAYALVSLCGIGDTYTFGNNHNAQLWVRPSDGKVLLFPWDMDFAFVRGAGSALTGDQALGRVLRLPSYSRQLLHHVHDITETTFQAEYMTPWVNYYAQLVGQNFRTVSNYINQRRNSVRSRLPREVEFRITTNDGADFATEEASVDLAGEAWIDFHNIIVAGADASPVRWTATTRWAMDIDLAPGANELSVMGVDRGGNPLQALRVAITRTGTGFFVRGDVDHSGALNIVDVLFLLRHLSGEVELPCRDAADVDDDEELTLTDSIVLLHAIFARGPIAAPFPEAGMDTDGGALDCAEGIQ